MREDPNIPEEASIENVPEIMEIIRERHAKLNENIIESNEINALLALYGDDEAVKSCANFFQDVYASIQANSTVSPDKYRLLCDLRRTLFPKTTVSPKDIYFITSKYSEYSDAIIRIFE